MKKELAAAALQKNPLPPLPHRWMKPLGDLGQCTAMASEFLDMVSESTYEAVEVLRMAGGRRYGEYHSLKDQMQSAHFNSGIRDVRSCFLRHPLPPPAHQQIECECLAWSLVTTDENVIRYELAREELLHMEDLNEEMSVKMVVLTEENDKLTRQNEKLRRQSSQSSSDRHDLISKLDDIETEVQGLRKKNSQLEQRNLNLEHRIKNLNELRDLDKQRV